MFSRAPRVRLSLLGSDSEKNNETEDITSQPSREHNETLFAYFYEPDAAGQLISSRITCDANRLTSQRVQRGGPAIRRRRQRRSAHTRAKHKLRLVEVIRPETR